MLFRSTPPQQRCLFLAACALVSAVLSLSDLAWACEGLDDQHGLRARSSRYATQPTGGADLLSPLTWGEVQIVATTDIHGWYQGHLHSTQPDPNYSGDFGDFASFVSHLRTLAAERGVDLLVVDSGDLHDGDGLSDGFPEGDTDGHVSNEIHSRVPYDLLAVGNHELYKYGVAYDTYTNFVPAQKGRYLASNVNISIYDERLGHNVSHVMGDRFVKFNTSQGRRVTSLGVLFDFKGQDGGITVENPLDMVKEAWFEEAIAEEPDFFLLVGHMPVRWDAWPNVVAAIRKVHKTTPILISGGHTHIRDCYAYDANAIGIEAGRYLETIGWLSVNMTRSPGEEGISYSRSYIDANRRNYAYHLNLSDSHFDTPDGSEITARMTDIAVDWNLTDVYGRAPQDYFLDRYPISSNLSVINLIKKLILQEMVVKNPSKENANRTGTPRFVVANTGFVRFDLYSGDFTKNDQYIVSPFIDAFCVIKDVEYRYASRILDRLNEGDFPWSAAKHSSEGHVSISAEDETEKMYGSEAYAKGEIGPIFSSWRAAQYEDQVEEDRARSQDRYLSSLLSETTDSTPSLGYVTRDSCPHSVGNGHRGDDTLHRAISYSAVPNYIATHLLLVDDEGGQSPTASSPPPPLDLDSTSEEKVDVILVEFVRGAVIKILNSLQTDKIYTTEDVSTWNELTTQDIFRLYAQKAWGGGGKGREENA